MGLGEHMARRRVAPKCGTAPCSTVGGVTNPCFVPPTGQQRGNALTGGYIPFAATKVEREVRGDPRPSLEERYGNREGYLCVLRAAARRDV